MSKEISSLKLSDFDYHLPKESIAQRPLPHRDDSRLLVLHRDTKKIEHRLFKELGLFLKKGDIVVFNETKVFKARLIGKREGFNGKVEILLTERISDSLYAALTKPSKRFRKGTRISFGKGELKAEVFGEKENFKLIQFQAEDNLMDRLEEIGAMPLPPYIKRMPDKEDDKRYQTVYARNLGAIAAPTAGLHFTQGMIERLKEQGVGTASLTLHVGYATFKAVKEEDITMHKMHGEYLEIPKATAERINEVKRNGGRVVAVGTTVCRALESAAEESGSGFKVSPLKGRTELFIYPGFAFRITDMLLTNFHLPRTTLLMLVSAFAGRDNIINAYEEAIRKRYRFYSYGDAMLII